MVGLRNSAHSLVKLMNPVAGPAVIVSSYTHPEYALSMAAVFALVGATALLLRGTEGEVVADARRLPQLDGFIAGRQVALEAGRKGTLTELPDLPREVDPAATAAYIADVLAGRKSVPDALALQVEHSCVWLTNATSNRQAHEYRQSHPRRRWPWRSGVADPQGPEGDPGRHGVAGG